MCCGEVVAPLVSFYLIRFRSLWFLSASCFAIAILFSSQGLAISSAVFRLSLCLFSSALQWLMWLCRINSGVPGLSVSSRLAVSSFSVSCACCAIFSVFIVLCVCGFPVRLGAFPLPYLLYAFYPFIVTIYLLISKVFNLRTLSGSAGASALSPLRLLLFLGCILVWYKTWR